MEKKRIVVFGATGTLGLYMVDYLVSTLNCEWEIVPTGRGGVDIFLVVITNMTRMCPDTLSHSKM